MFRGALIRMNTVVLCYDIGQRHESLDFSLIKVHVVSHVAYRIYCINLRKIN